MEEYISRKSETVKNFLSTVDRLMEKLDELRQTCRPALQGERYLTNEQLSELLHICPRTLQEYRDKGVLPFIALEGKILYKETDIEKLLKDNYRSAFPEE